MPWPTVKHFHWQLPHFCIINLHNLNYYTQGLGLMRFHHTSAASQKGPEAKFPERLGDEQRSINCLSNQRAASLWAQWNHGRQIWIPQSKMKQTLKEDKLLNGVIYWKVGFQKTIRMNQLNPSRPQMRNENIVKIISSPCVNNQFWGEASAENLISMDHIFLSAIW